jgi:hypothetical protein
LIGMRSMTDYSHLLDEDPPLGALIGSVTLVAR